jgi:hypothetical protein
MVLLLENNGQLIKIILLYKTIRERERVCPIKGLFVSIFCYIFRLALEKFKSYMSLKVRSS